MHTRSLDKNPHSGLVGKSCWFTAGLAEPRGWLKQVIFARSVSSRSEVITAAEVQISLDFARRNTPQLKQQFQSDEAIVPEELSRGSCE